MLYRLGRQGIAKDKGRYPPIPSCSRNKEQEVSMKVVIEQCLESPTDLRNGMKGFLVWLA